MPALILIACLMFQAHSARALACPPTAPEADCHSANERARRARSGRVLAWFESDPAKRAKGPDISVPGPDLANFPNSSSTLPQWAAYIESTPLNLATRTDLTPPSYNWEVLVRLGLTDNIEARLFTGGLTVYFDTQPTSVGFLPLTFDSKVHLAEHAWRYFNFSLGLEGYVQTTWGSASFTNGIQYSVSLLADHDLPWKLAFEWNVGFVRTFDDQGQQQFVPTWQGALQRPLIGKLAIFVQSYRGAVTLPRAALNRGSSAGRYRGAEAGVGLQWIVSTRWALFGSFNAGHGPLAPLLSGSAGLAASL